MARKSFFSFHYRNDVSRAMVVRNSWVTKADREAAGFIDGAAFEEIKKKGEASVKEWIDGQLKNTTVTVVLIGLETSSRPYVKYEVVQSYARGNGMFGIYIHQIKDLNGKTSSKGTNQFGEIGKDSSGQPVYFSAKYPTYDWVDNNGYENIGAWIRAAAEAAGK